MRLLVFDEEIFAGGVETLCFNLLPALARRCETLVWAVPDHLHSDFRARIGDVPNLIIEGHNWPLSDARGIAERAARKLSKAFGAASRPMHNARIRALADQYCCTHFLTTCVFTQPFPVVDQPVFGFVCDVNPAMPQEAKCGIAAWLEEAAGIFAISAFTRAELQRMQPAHAEKIHSIPLAAPPLDSWNPKPVSQREFDFYYPAAVNPHKNHLVLFQACAELAREGRKFRLAISGPGADGFLPEGNFANPEMEKARLFLREHAALLNGAIQVAGEVKPAEVSALYGNARCVVLPSAYEGFGLPLAEALARGMPVICSDIPPFREQIALYGTPRNVCTFPAGDAAQLAAALRDFIDRGNNTPLEKPAPPWTWEDAAQRCFELLSRSP